MRSERRRKILEKRRNGKGMYPVLIKILIPLFLILLVWIFLRVNTKYWNGSDKFDYVFREPNGNVAVTVLDPKLNEITTMVIPGDTQVDVAGNYGTLRIKNVWQLGVNEKKGGSLLAATVTKNFLSPVFLWSENEKGGATNIPVGDRLAIMIFSLQVKSIDRSEIDLGKSQFLKKTNLSDGQPGYILSGPVSARLTVSYSDNDFADQNLRVDIVDATGVPGSANTVGQIVEVLGGKVVSIDRQVSPEDTDCTVLGMNPKIVRKIANLFGCSTDRGKSSFDLEIRLGSKFAKRF